MRQIKVTRWVVLVVLALFSLFHQADKLIIGPLASQIMNTFSINETQLGAVNSITLLVSGLLFPVWGYISDRYSRARLIALAAFIWSSTTWLSSLAPNYTLFLISRASTGVDDASYPSVYSILADYFPPLMRGRIYAILKIVMPLGYILGAAIAILIGSYAGWRNVFKFTAFLGLLIAILILLLVRDVPRGAMEVEAVRKSNIRSVGYSFATIRDLFKRRTLIALYGQGFFAVFSINALTFWAFRYLEVDRGYSGTILLGTSIVIILSIVAGLQTGGIVGDWLFKKRIEGRLITGAMSIGGAVIVIFALLTPVGSRLLFLILVSVGLFFTGFAAPNISATLSDISLPEVRSSIFSLQCLVETVGSALAPFVTGWVATRSNLRTAFIAIIAISVLFLIPCYVIAIKSVASDIELTRAGLLSRGDK